MKLSNKNLAVSTFIAIFISISLAGCGEPIPEDKMNYIGEWQGAEMYLLIQQDGRLKYKRSKKIGNTSITGPIKEFKGDDFIVGILFLTTTFEVSKPPYEVDGVWKMEVDGVTLTRTRE